MKGLLVAPEFWDAISRFAWPFTFLIVVLSFRKSIHGLFQKEGVTLKFAGAEISVAKVAEKAGKDISDLQERLAKLEVATKDGSEIHDGTSPPVCPNLPKEFSILWVDDYPVNNVFIKDRLEDEGVKVTLELSTASAIKALKNYDIDLIITDLGRIESGIENKFAGLDLIREVRSFDPDLPILVFAGQRAMDQRDQLFKAGATEVFRSAIDVFKFVIAHREGS